jgi:superfamily II DNA or RNA helicase
MPTVSINKHVKIIHNPVTAQVVTEDRDLKFAISEMLSYEIAGADHRTGSSFGSRSSFFKFKNNTFPTGFVRLVRKRLERVGYSVLVISKPAPKPLGPARPKVDDFPPNADYDYQYDTADRLVSLKGMIAQIATGGGKSRIFKICAERIGRPTLFVTTRTILMHQMANIYSKDLGKEHGMIGDGLYSPTTTGVNFATIDTLASHLTIISARAEFEKLRENYIEKREALIFQVLKKMDLPTDFGQIAVLPKQYRLKIEGIRQKIIDKKPIPTEFFKAKSKAKYAKAKERKDLMVEFLSHIEFVCLEEAHEVSSASYYKVMNACKNAHYRLALTATPFMKDDEEANMRLMATTGTIAIRITVDQLIKAGILAKPYFKLMSYARPKKLYRTTKWQRAYSEGIINNVERNGHIVSECVRASEHQLPAMALVQREAHGRLLCKLLKAKGLRAVFINGSSDQKKRQKELGRMESGEIDVLIGSTILDVGVDVPAVGLVVLAGGGKAEVAFRQRVGRGMRKKKNGSNVVYIVEFQDDYNEHLIKHARHRIGFINSTPGFKDNIVPDFDYHGHGFKKVKSRIAI